MKRLFLNGIIFFKGVIIIKRFNLSRLLSDYRLEQEKKRIEMEKQRRIEKQIEDYKNGAFNLLDRFIKVDAPEFFKNYGYEAKLGEDSSSIMSNGEIEISMGQSPNTEPSINLGTLKFYVNIGGEQKLKLFAEVRLDTPYENLDNSEILSLLNAEKISIQADSFFYKSIGELLTDFVYTEKTEE